MDESVKYIRQKMPFEPEVGIVLGSGLGGLADKIEQPVFIDYSDIPGFVCSTAPGHKGRFVFGVIAGKKTVCMQGRMHFYEGYSMDSVTLGVRVMNRLGIKTLLLTNAAGAVNTDFTAGDIMLITDHINFQGTNPLIGKNVEDDGPRFPDMTYTYTPELCDKAREAAAECGITLREGIYMAFTGPSYETPAEIRMARALGADAVGMSTVPEAIVASQCGLKLTAFSLMSNMAAGITKQRLSGEEVIEMGIKSAARMEALVIAFLKKL